MLNYNYASGAPQGYEGSYGCNPMGAEYAYTCPDMVGGNGTAGGNAAMGSSNEGSSHAVGKLGEKPLAEIDTPEDGFPQSVARPPAVTASQQSLKPKAPSLPKPRNKEAPARRRLRQAESEASDSTTRRRARAQTQSEDSKSTSVRSARRLAPRDPEDGLQRKPRAAAEPEDAIPQDTEEEGIEGTEAVDESAIDSAVLARRAEPPQKEPRRQQKKVECENLVFFGYTGGLIGTPVISGKHGAGARNTFPRRLHSSSSQTASKASLSLSSHQHSTSSLRSSVSKTTVETEVAPLAGSALNPARARISGIKLSAVSALGGCVSGSKPSADRGSISKSPRLPPVAGPSQSTPRSSRIAKGVGSSLVFDSPGGTAGTLPALPPEEGGAENLAACGGDVVRTPRPGRGRSIQKIKL